MTGADSLPNHASNVAYWARRREELTRLANALYVCVDTCKGHQAELIKLGETEKIGSEAWETAMKAAGQALRNARSTRSRFQKQLYGMRDTMRIRTHLAADAPDGLSEELERGIHYLNYLQAMGF